MTLDLKRWFPLHLGYEVVNSMFKRQTRFSNLRIHKYLPRDRRNLCVFNKVINLDYKTYLKSSNQIPNYLNESQLPRWYKEKIKIFFTYKAVYTNRFLSAYIGLLVFVSIHLKTNQTSHRSWKALLTLDWNFKGLLITSSLRDKIGFFLIELTNNFSSEPIAFVSSKSKASREQSPTFWPFFFFLITKGKTSLWGTRLNRKESLGEKGTLNPDSGPRK